VNAEPTLGEIARTVERVESKLDKAIDDHEQRLRRAERWIYALPPTLLLAAGSAAAQLLRGGG